MKPLLVILLFCGSLVYAQDVVDLVNEGIAFHDQGEYAKAIEKYRDALQIEPNNGNVYYEMAFSYHLMQDYAPALEAAEMAIKLSGPETKLMALIVKGSILDDSGLSEESAKFYEASLKEFPDSYLMRFNYGITLNNLGRVRDAEQAFITVLQKNFYHPGTHLRLAYIRRSQNRNVPASLGMYYFLMLENKTERAVDAASHLLQWIYGKGNDSTKNKTIYITLPDKSANSKLGAAELFFGMMGSVRKDINNTVPGAEKPGSQLGFVEDTKNYFSTLSELGTNSKKKGRKKKNQETVSDDETTAYVRFFSALHDSGHTEALCYHIMQGTGNAEVADWLAANQEKLQLFYLWHEINGKIR